MSHSEIKCFLKRQHSGKLCEWGNFILNSSARSHAAIFEEVVFVSHFYEADIYFVSDSVDCRPLSVRSSISVKGTSCEVSVVFIRKRHLSKNLHWLAVLPLEHWATCWSSSVFFGSVLFSDGAG